MIWLILLALLCVAAQGFFSGSEIGAYRLNRIRLRHRAEAGDPRAHALAKLLRRPQEFVCMTLAGTNVSVYGASAIATALFVPVAGRYAEVVATLALAPVLLVFAEVLPKSIFHSYPNRIMFALRWPLVLAHYALWPATWVLVQVAGAIDRLAGAPPEKGWELSLRRLFDFFAEGAREGVLTREQNAMAQNVMKFSETPVSRVMIPLDKVALVPTGIAPQGLRVLLVERDHTRLPVYEGERGRLAGVLNVLDYLCAEGDPPLGEVVRPLAEVPAEATVGDAFASLQERRQVMAAVADADGRALGIVTMKDLVEEVVGEIEEW